MVVRAQCFLFLIGAIFISDKSNYIEAFLLPVSTSINQRMSPEHFFPCPRVMKKMVSSSATSDSTSSIDETATEEDSIMEDALNRAMHSMAIDWAPQCDDITLQDRDSVQSSSSRKKPSSPSPYETYQALVEPPPCHKVYYQGHHAHSFWRQGRDIIQLVIPVEPLLSKKHVHFRMESQTHLFLALGPSGEERAIFNQDLAQPVYRDSTFWYFDEPDSQHKVIIIELDKRMSYSNWPRLFSEDPDPSSTENNS